MRSDSVAYRESATRALEVKEEQLDLVENFYKKFRDRAFWLIVLLIVIYSAVMEVTLFVGAMLYVLQRLSCAVVWFSTA